MPSNNSSSINSNELVGNVKSILDSVLNSADESQIPNGVRSLTELARTVKSPDAIISTIWKVVSTDQQAYAIKGVVSLINQYQSQVQAKSQDSLRRAANRLFFLIKAISIKNVAQCFAEIRLTKQSPKEVRQLNGSDRMKGRVLVALFTQYFPADLRKKEYFYRWKVRANPNYVKTVINKLVLRAKITPEIAYWRLRNLISSRFDDSLFARKLGQFEYIWNRLVKSSQKKFKRIAFSEILAFVERLKYFEAASLDLEKRFIKIDKRRAIRVLKEHEKICRLKIKFFTIMKSTTLGQMKKLFLLWKALPVIYDPKDKRVMFESKLFMYMKKRNNRFIRSLTAEYEVAMVAKRKAMITFLQKCMSSNKYAFNHWAYQTRQDKQYRKCQRVIAAFEHVNSHILQSSLIPLNASRQIYRAIPRVLEGSGKHATNSLRILMKRWHSNAAELHGNRESVKGTFSNLLSRIKFSKTKHLNDALYAFHHHARVRAIQQKFFKNLLSTKSGQVTHVFKKWQQLPARTLVPANLLQNGLQRFATRRLRGFIDAIRSQHATASSIKLRALQELLSRTQSLNRKCFVMWRQRVATEAMVKKCKQTMIFFEQMRLNLKSNIVYSLESDDRTKRVIALLTRMTDHWKIAMQRGYFIWRDSNRTQKFNELMRDQSQAENLRILKTGLNKKSNKQLKDTLRSFYVHDRVRKVQLRVVAALLDTNSGKVLDLFTRWKKLPVFDPVAMAAKVKASKFSNALHFFSTNTNRRFFDSVKDIHSEAIMRKNRAMSAIIGLTTQQHSRMFYEWRNRNRSEKEANKCKLTMSIFESLNRQISAQMDTLKEYNLEMRRKTAALARLSRNFILYKQIAFDRWRASISELRAEEETGDEMTKRSSISRLNSKQNEFAVQRLKLALHKFRVNRIVQIRRFQLFRAIDIGQRKKLHSAMIQWMNLPQRNFPKQSNEFQKRIEELSRARLRPFLQFLRNSYNQGDNIKEAAVTRLVTNLKALQRDVIYRMQENKNSYNRQHRMAATNKLFTIVSNLLTKNIPQTLFEDQKLETNSKRNAISVVVNFEQGFLRGCLEQWRKSKNDSIKVDETRNKMIAILNRLSGATRKEKLKESLEKFNHHRKITNLKQKYLNKIITNFSGNIHVFIYKWKYLPAITNSERIQELSRFHSQLSAFAERKSRVFFDGMLTLHRQSEKLKRRCLVELLDKNKSNQKYALHRWSTVSCKSKLRAQCKLVSSFFLELNSILVRNTLRNISTDPKSARLMRTAILRMQQTSDSRVKEAWHLWRSLVSFKRIDDCKESLQLRNAIYAMQRSKQQSMRAALRAFYTNNRILQVQKRFFQGLERTSAGQLASVFRKWHTLPNRNVLPAENLNIALARFADNRAKAFITALRGTYELGLDCKRKTAQTLIQRTLSNTHRAVQLWQNVNRSTKIIEQCQATVNVFALIQNVLHANTSLVFQSTRNQQLAMKMLSQLVRNTESKRTQAFHSWRQATGVKRLLEDRNQRAMLALMKHKLSANEELHTRAALRTFYQHMRVEKIKKNFFASLLNSPAGQLLKSFMKWKEIPAISEIEMQKRAKSVRLFSALDKLQQNSLGLPLEIIKDTHQEALDRKKRVLMKWASGCISQQQRLFSKWQDTARATRTRNLNKTTLQFFATMNELVLQQANATLLHSLGNHEKRLQSIRTIITNHQQLRKNSFLRWSHKVTELKARDTHAQSTLMHLRSALSSHKSYSLASALESFKKNVRCRQIVYQIFKTIDKRQQADAFNCFQKWRLLPDNSSKEKQHQFAEGLSRFANQRIGQVHRKIVNAGEKGNALKKRAVSFILLRQHTRIKQAFDRWNFHQPEVQARKCALTVSLFHELHMKLNRDTRLLFEAKVASEMRSNNLEKLIELQRNRVKHAMHAWRKNAFQQALSDENRKLAIQRFQLAAKNSSSHQLRSAIRAFAKHANIKRIHMNFFKKLLSSTNGQKIATFQKWKALPEFVPDAVMTQALKSESILSAFATRRVRGLMDALKEHQNRGNAIKRDNLHKLIGVSESESRVAFYKWKQLNNVQNITLKTRYTLTLFTTLNQKLHDIFAFASSIHAYPTLPEAYVPSKFYPNINNSSASPIRSNASSTSAGAAALNQSGAGPTNSIQSSSSSNLNNRAGPASSNLNNPQNGQNNNSDSQYNGEPNNRNGGINNGRNGVNNNNSDNQQNGEPNNRNGGINNGRNGVNNNNSSNPNNNNNNNNSNNSNIGNNNPNNINNNSNASNPNNLNGDSNSIINPNNNRNGQSQNQNNNNSNNNNNQLLPPNQQNELTSPNRQRGPQNSGSEQQQPGQQAGTSQQSGVSTGSPSNPRFASPAGATGASSAAGTQGSNNNPINGSSSQNSTSPYNPNNYNNNGSSSSCQNSTSPYNQNKGISGNNQNAATMSTPSRQLSSSTSDPSQPSNQSNYASRGNESQPSTSSQPGHVQRLQQQKSYRPSELTRAQAIHSLIRFAQKKQNDSFERWRSAAHNKTTTEKCKRVIGLFESMHTSLSNRIMPLFDARDKNRIKAKAIYQMLNYSKDQLRSAMKLWATNVRFEKLSEGTKQAMVILLKNALHNSATANNRKILEKFRKAAAIHKYQKQFFNSICGTRMGQKMVLFTKWKTIPEYSEEEKKRRTQASTFVRKLADLFTEPKQNFFNSIKDRYAEALARMKPFAHPFLRLCPEQKLKSSFLLWSKASTELSRVDTINKTTRLFELISERIRSNFENTLTPENGSLANPEKVTKLVVLFQRVHGLYLKRISDGLNMISKKSGSVTLRQYFASLWKWKFANLEAKYYMRYKQIYHQSAILSRFVQILSEKHRKMYAAGVDALRNSQGKYMHLLTCCRIYEREIVKRKAEALSKWKHRVNFENYHDNFSHLTTNYTYTRLGRVCAIALRSKIALAFRSVKAYSSAQYKEKVRLLSVVLAVTNEKAEAARKRNLLSGFDAMKYRIGVQNTSKKMQGLFKLINMDSLRVKQLHYAFGQMFAAVHDHFSNEWEKRTVEQIIGLTDIRFSFEILRNVALRAQQEQIRVLESQRVQELAESADQNEYGRRQNSRRASANRRDTSRGPSASSSKERQNYQSGSNLSLKVPKFGESNISQTQDGSFQQIKREKSNTELSNLPNDRENPESEDQVGYNAILSRIGDQNFAVLNRLGAADHIYGILSSVFNRSKAQHFSAINLYARQSNSPSKYVKQSESMVRDLQNELRKRRGEDTLQKQQLKELLRDKEGLERQVSEEISRNESQKEQIYELEYQLSHLIGNLEHSSSAPNDRGEDEDSGHRSALQSQIERLFRVLTRITLIRRSQGFQAIKANKN